MSNPEDLMATSSPTSSDNKKLFVPRTSFARAKMIEDELAALEQSFGEPLPLGLCRNFCLTRSQDIHLRYLATTRGQQY